MPDQHLWPHQLDAYERTLAAIQAGEQRICLCAPTGAGKTRIVTEIIEYLVARGYWVPIFTHRQLLIDMLRKQLTAAGLPFGMRVSGYETDGDQQVQICSMQTERVRTLARTSGTLWSPHGLQPGEKVCAIFDECHLMTGPSCRDMMDLYTAHGQVCLGISATPVGLWPVYTHLIQAGTTSSCRDCGALVWAEHFAPDEPACERIKTRAGTGIPLGKELTEDEAASAIMSPTIFGRVVEHWLRLNPEQQPTILFGPGRPESLWFAEQFAFPELRAKEYQHFPAISAAHIDGEQVWCNGRSVRTSEEARNAVIEAHRKGEVKVLCNRFVMREGVNMPWLRCGILATIFGTLKSYIQACGRLLRADPASGKDGALIIDHGGNYWRHLSVNADHDWDMRMTDGQLATRLAETYRNPADPDRPPPQPFPCPKCSRVLLGKRCQLCGWELPVGTRKSRPVIEVDGSLALRDAEIFKPTRKMSDRARAAKLWEGYYYRATRHKFDPTFHQLENLFARENNWQYPPRDLPFMPKNPDDLFRKVRLVDAADLVPKQEGVLSHGQS